MQGYTAEAYKLFVRRCLNRTRNRAIGKLKTIFRQSKHLQAQVLDIVILPCGILKELPVTLFFKDRSQKPVPGGTFALGNMIGPVLTPAEEELVYCYDDNGVETIEIELQIVIEWFSECWLAANGTDLPTPAFLSIKNDLEALDLKKMNWIPNPAGNSKINLTKKEYIP